MLEKCNLSEEDVYSVVYENIKNTLPDEDENEIEKKVNEAIDK